MGFIEAVRIAIEQAQEEIVEKLRNELKIIKKKEDFQKELQKIRDEENHGM